ncbi:MAG TPA: SCO family protein [Blastocatellia bacterium]|nr:SCO family protein [Blastocatellia bacterium]
MQNVRILSAALLIVLFITTLSSCGGKPEPQHQYQLKGKVVEINRKDKLVTISHDDIPGYMVAMTMPFKLKDERLLNEMEEGDRIQATLVIAGLKSWLEDVVVTRETADPSDISKSSKWTEPKPGEEVPNFNLVNQSGKRLSFRDYKGNAVIVTFIYTRCPLPDYCPLMTENFSQILAALKSESEKYLKTHLLSITLDPEYDSPKVLSEYAAAYSADLERWDFATGTKDEIKKVATYFGLQYWTEGDQVIHSLRTAIVGSDGRLIKLYRGNEWKPDEILKELRITPPTSS